MSKLTTVYPSPADLSKVDPSDRARAIFRAAHSQARRQLRTSSRYGLGSRYGRALDALRNRFGASGWKVAQAAVAIAFDGATIAKAATGTREELAREGMLTRCVRLEAAPRGLGWLWAFTFDALGSPN